MAATTVSTPLLQAADEVDGLEAGVPTAAGLVDAADLAELFNAQPETVIKYIGESGSETLGTFIYENELTPDLVTDSFVTIGTDKEDIDWRAEWKQRLDALAPPSTKGPGWTTSVEIEACMVKIKHPVGNHEMDQPDDYGLLSILINSWQDGACPETVFTLDAVKAVIGYKWRRWAQRYLMWEFSFYMMWLLGYQVFVLLFQDENVTRSLGELLMTRLGFLTVAALIISFLGMIPFIYIEVVTLLEWGFAGWFSVWNVLDISAYTFQVIITIMYLGRLGLMTSHVSILMAVQNLLLWMKVQYFSRVFESTKIAFVDTMKQVLKDVSGFLLVLLMAMWGFAGAFYILMRQDQDIEQFETVTHSMMTTLMFMLGGVDPSLFYHSHNPTAGIILLLLYIFTMSLILLNCLIAITIDSWSKVTANEEMALLSSKAQIIDELETTVPNWLKRKLPAWYPPYVHFARLVPTKPEDDPTSLALPQLDYGDPVFDLKRTVERLQRQLDRQSAMLGKLTSLVDDTDGDLITQGSQHSTGNGQASKA